MSTLMIVIQSLEYCSFVISFEIGKCASNFVLFQDSFGYSGFLKFSYEIKDQLVNFCQASWGFDIDYTESVDQFWAILPS